jgi:hypothetical protein
LASRTHARSHPHSHVVGSSLQLRRIPLLVFRHAGMVTDEEDKRMRGRAGSRPGDVLRMYRMFTALRHDPDRVRAEQFLRSTLTADALQHGLPTDEFDRGSRADRRRDRDDFLQRNGVQSAEGAEGEEGLGEDGEAEEEEGGSAALEQEFADSIEDEHGNEPRAHAGAALDEVWRREEEEDLQPEAAAEQMSVGSGAGGKSGKGGSGTGKSGLDARDRRGSLVEGAAQRLARETQQRKEDQLVAMLKDSIRSVNADAQSGSPHSGKSGETNADAEADSESQAADDAAAVQSDFDREVAAAVSAAETLSEQQAILLRAKGAGVGRFADQARGWFRWQAIIAHQE